MPSAPTVSQTATDLILTSGISALGGRLSPKKPCVIPRMLLASAVRREVPVRLTLFARERGRQGVRFSRERGIELEDIGDVLALPIVVLVVDVQSRQTRLFGGSAPRTVGTEHNGFGHHESPF